MPRYIIERNVEPMSREALEAVARRSKQVVSEMPGLIWIKSYVSEKEGKIYCEYDAPSPEALIEHARRTGIPVYKISEVAIEISPDMFV
jgi:hypothetical protein